MPRPSHLSPFLRTPSFPVVRRRAPLNTGLLLSILMTGMLSTGPSSALADSHTPSPQNQRRAVGTAETMNFAPHPSGLSSVLPESPWEHTVTRPGAAFLKPRFTRVDLKPGHLLRILDGQGARDRTDHRPRPHRQRRRSGGLSVPGDRMTLRLETTDRSNPYQRPPFRLVQLMVGDAEVMSSFLPSWSDSQLPAAAKSICEPAEFTDAICHQGDSARWSNAQATAGIMEIIGDQAFFCTGVNVSPRNLVLTTESCLADTAACENAEFFFGQYRESCGSGDVSSAWQSYRCLETVASQPFDNQCEPAAGRLDFSLHRIDGEAAATWGYADPDPTALSSGEGLYIFQHADGRPLELSEGSGADVVVDGQTLRYFGSLDTESSSVGSPVFRDADDRLVALHHCGGCASPTLGNRAVMMSDIEPLIAPFLCEGSVTLEPIASDDFSPVSGNGDAVLDPGETWQLTPRLLNAACTADASAITADFQAAAGSVPITLLDTTSTFGGLTAGTSGDGTPIRFTVGAGQSCDGQVVLDLVSITANEGGFSGESAYATKEIGEVPTSTLLSEGFGSGIPMTWTVDHQGTGDGGGLYLDHRRSRTAISIPLGLRDRRLGVSRPRPDHGREPDHAGHRHHGFFESQPEIRPPIPLVQRRDGRKGRRRGALVGDLRGLDPGPKIPRRRRLWLGTSRSHSLWGWRSADSLPLLRCGVGVVVGDRRGRAAGRQRQGLFHRHLRRRIRIPRHHRLEPNRPLTRAEASRRSPAQIFVAQPSIKPRISFISLPATVAVTPGSPSGPAPTPTSWVGLYSTKSAPTKSTPGSPSSSCR